MRQQLVIVLGLCSCLCAVMAFPMPMPASEHRELDMLQIPIGQDKEIDVLTLSAKEQEELIAERNKRTAGILRDLFPELTKETITDTQIDLSAINRQLEETIRVARQVKEAEAAAQAAAVVAAAGSQQSSGSGNIEQFSLPGSDNDAIQLNFNAGGDDDLPSLSGDDAAKNINSNELGDTKSSAAALDDLSLDGDDDTVDLDDRNKRFLVGGGAAGGVGGNALGGGAAPAGGAGGAGSGNFLFDIVRLFSGSIQTQTQDAAAVAGSTGAGGSVDTNTVSGGNRSNTGLTEGIPGPVTRLIVLGNRGLANLIQDLILRVAATSEKFVNFKARLITALI